MAGGVRVIDLKRVDKYKESEHEILFQLVKQFNVPEKLRCASQRISELQWIRLEACGSEALPFLTENPPERFYAITAQ